MELPSLLNKLANFRHKSTPTAVVDGGQYGQSGTLTRSGHSGTLTRSQKHGGEHSFYGPVKNLGESDRDMSTSSPVLLEMYDHVKVGEYLNVKKYMQTCRK